jgi:prepilin peptidase CpaA
MWTTLVLLVCLSVAAWTDVRSGLIYNWTTYPGIMGSLAARYADGGRDAAVEGLCGLMVCGGVVLFIFLFGGTGGGDVKLIALLGAGLGVYDGLEAMLWTFVLGAVMAVCVLVWQVGAVRLLRHCVAQVIWSVRLRGWMPLTPEERAPLKRTLFLAPAAWMALLLVRGEELQAAWTSWTFRG